MAEIDINGRKYRINSQVSLANPNARSGAVVPNSRGSFISVAGVGQAGSYHHGNEGVYISSDYYRNDIIGKPYPGRVTYHTQRTLAQYSTVVAAILNTRSHQVAKLPIKIVPSNKNEPPRQINILDYSVYDLEHVPAFDDDEVAFLTKIYSRIDPKLYLSDKKSMYEDTIDDYTPGERATVEYLQEKHDDFYRKRNKDIKKIEKLLKNPDPYFTNTDSWQSLVKKILSDGLIIDRGIILKIRDDYGELKGLMPADGALIRPLINEYGIMDDEKAYVQVVNGAPRVYLSKKDVAILSMQPVTDIRYFGYGMSLMETLYTTVLSDIYIDKGNLDYYRKGGSIPEGFINIEPLPSKEGAVSQLDQEQLSHIQRHLESIIMGDFTQIPIISGGKVSWIDFKGKRRDMQFKELADYLTRKICAVFQVSPQDVGILSDINRANSITQAEMTKSKGLETLMMSISEFFTSNIISELRPEGDLRLWFEDDDLGRKKEEWTITQQQIISGVQSINEYRATQGKHPVPWGNTPLQGLRNWKPEDESGGMPGMPGMPSLGALPPMSGMPSPDNPSGPAGGPNPGAGQDAQPPGGPTPIGSPSALKATRFFGMASASEDNAEELMIKSLSNMYIENARFRDFVELQDIHNYPGAEFLRSPIESYEFFSRENMDFGVTIHKAIDVDEADPLVFSRYVGNGNIIVDESGEEPIIKSITRGIIENLPEDKREFLQELSYGNVEELVERAVYSRLDTGLKNYLHEDFYRFQAQTVTDAQVQEAGEYLGFK